MRGLTPFNDRNPKFPSSPFNMIDNFFNNVPSFRNNFATNMFKVDVKETEDNYQIEAEVPGINKEDIDLSLDDEGRLTISVEQSDSQDEKDEDDNYIHRERHYQSMQRSVYLAKANPDSVNAKMEDGLLKITVGKQDQTVENRHKIEIE